MRGHLPSGRVLDGTAHLGAHSAPSRGEPQDLLRSLDGESGPCGQRVEIEFLIYPSEATELEGIGGFQLQIGRDGVEARQALWAAPP